MFLKISSWKSLSGSTDSYSLDWGSLAADTELRSRVAEDRRESLHKLGNLRRLHKWVELEEVEAY